MLIAMLVTAIAYIIPGAALLYALSGSGVFSLTYSPIASVGLISLLGVFCGAVGIPAGLVCMILIPVTLCVIAILFKRFLAERHRRSQLQTPRNSHGEAPENCQPKSYFALATQGYCGDSKYALLEKVGIPALYIAIGCLVMSCVFLANLLDQEMMIPAYDGLFHVNLVRNFADSANYSSLDTSLYRGLSDTRAPMIYGGFYPAAWHAMTALVLTTTTVPEAISVNASLFIIGGIVFPMGLYTMNAFIFNFNTKKLLAGAVVAPLLVVLPWWLAILQGAQFAQLLAFALVPYAVALFGWFVDPLLFYNQAGIPVRSLRSHIIPALIILLSCVAVSLAQPNGIFAIGVFGVSYLMEALYVKWFKFAKNKINIIKYLLFYMAICATWILLYKLPALSNVVHFNWEHTQLPKDALGQVFSFSFNGNLPAQWLFTVLLVAGLLTVLAIGKCWWTIVSAIYFGAAYVLSTSTEGTLKHLFGGFWYTDPNRLASFCIIAMVPILTLGLWTIVSWLVPTIISIVGIHKPDPSQSSIVGKSLSPHSGPFPAAVVIGVGALVVSIALMPSYILSPSDRIQTSFGVVEDQIRWLSDPASETLLNQSKRSFADQVKAIVGDDLVVNVPDDMSAFLYARDGLNVYYRRNQVPSSEEEYDSSETPYSKLLRLKLDQYATNPEVQLAVKTTGAKYVLKLVGNHTEGHFHTYQSQDWQGIVGITAETPGFKLLLSDGEMQLYEIVPVDQLPSYGYDAASQGEALSYNPSNSTSNSTRNEAA